MDHSHSLLLSKVFFFLDTDNVEQNSRSSKIFTIYCHYNLVKNSLCLLCNYTCSIQQAKKWWVILGHSTSYLLSLCCSFCICRNHLPCTPDAGSIVTHVAGSSCTVAYVYDLVLTFIEHGPVVRGFTPHKKYYYLWNQSVFVQQCPDINSRTVRNRNLHFFP